MSTPTPLDPLVTSTLDAHTLQTSSTATATSPDSDTDTDALLDSLADSPAFAAHRAARMQQLSTQLSLQKTLRQDGHGVVTTCKDEKEVMDYVTAKNNTAGSGGGGGGNRTLCHFYHPGFHRCGVMDGLLEGLAGPHVEVRFLRVEAGKAEWLCARLGVRVLPCVVGWVDGVEVGRCVGFEGVGGGVGKGKGNKEGEEGGVGGLERVLVERGVLVRVKVGESGEVVRRRREGKEKEEEDEGDDWD
ncbi:hypothetical protein MMC30_009224 [Trapelia coarctata]|nr:hypothetical protein [Trapelia coarctata]